MKYALDILTNKQEVPPPFLTNFYNPVLLGIAGFGSIAFSNYMLRKPLLSGIQRHIAVGIGGVFLGIWANKKLDEYTAERDAVLRHYIELHPDDFPDPQRKKFGELLLEWIPVR